ncbi:maker638 [Drosophila busckii]|uniref:Maker638 n=1 Tax=Drosophila busckii TaxID=30019 RepID=A0A0M4EJA3_DROBS|nr:maker638 [Drosophila busckii]
MNPQLSCNAYSPGVHTIEVPGLKPFKVLCSDHSTVGPGWIVIQQRIDGKEEFQRDWKSYRNGFGSFQADFFLGMDKIHYITNSQRHELYIHMELQNSSIYARYDSFQVGSEQDLFELQSLGAYTGTDINDQMRYQEHGKFSTFDRDNDKLPEKNCATDFHYGGWWYEGCASWCVIQNLFPYA